MSRTPRWIELFFLIGVLFQPACEGAQTAVGTNTNWMIVCDEDADCDAPDACLCGRCSQNCNEDADCPVGHRCAAESAAVLQCGVEATRLCQPGCQMDDDCEEGRLCHLGSCTDPGLALSCPEAALACEDFEASLGGDVPITTDGNELESEEIPAPSGSFALRATVVEAPSVSYLRRDIDLSGEDELHLSAWVRVPVESEHDMAPIGFWTGAEDSWALRTVIRNGGLEIWSETDSLAGRAELAFGGWHCLEMHVLVADEGAVSLKANGEEVLSASGVDTSPDGGIQAVAMGAFWAGFAGDMLVDRVVLSREEAGCY